VLTPQKFGRLREIEVDPPQAGGPSDWESQIVAQPHVAAGVQWPDGTRKDVLVVCTMHGTVYAFDIASDYAQLWARWLGEPVADFGGADTNVHDDKDIYKTNPEWGVLSTPTIDLARRRLFVTHWANVQGGRHLLHSLDLLTGTDVRDPVAIEGTVKKANGGDLAFDPVFHKQRPGLLRLDPSRLPADRRGLVGDEGTVYIGFGASIENGREYHGWVFAYDAKSLSRKAVWCTTPNGNGAGIWQAGQGLTADTRGDIYLMTGNGSADPMKSNFGQSFVKLSPSLALVDYFMPWNWKQLNEGIPDPATGKIDEDTRDFDLGSAGPVCVVAHGRTFVVGGGKEGRLYCLDPANLGKLGDAVHKKNNVLSEIQATQDPPGHAHGGGHHHHHLHGSPVYWLGPQGLRLYVWGENDVLRSFTIDPSGKLAATAMGKVVAPEGMPGGMLSISTNAQGNGIVWAAMPLRGDANKQRLADGVLRAFDATTLEELWHSDRTADALGHFAKFTPPTVSGGRVYVATYDRKLVVYGLK
jgi:outer membrane protein assembly factor BamB